MPVLSPGTRVDTIKEEAAIGDGENFFSRLDAKIDEVNRYHTGQFL